MLPSSNWFRTSSFHGGDYGFESRWQYKQCLNLVEDSRVEDRFDSYALQSGHSLFSKAPDEEKMCNS